MYCNQEFDFCFGHDATLLSFSERPKWACQKWPTEQLSILHYPLSLCLCILYVSLIAGAERVNVEVLMGKISWHHVLTISGLFLPGLDWQHQLRFQSGIILRDTASIIHTTLTLINMSTRTHVRTCWRQLWHPLLPPLGIRSL